MRRFLLSVLTLSLVVSACTGDDGDDAAARRRATTRLEARLLRPTDLPSVYSSVKVSEDDADSSSQCGISASLERKDRVATARVAYQSASSQAQLDQTISRYEPGVARALLARARKLPRDCASFTEEQGGSKVTLRTASLPFPTLLDETVALKVTGAAGTTQLAFDQVFMRLGDTVVVLVHGGLGAVDTAVTEQLARIAAKKMTESPTPTTVATSTTTAAA